ncbi:MAG: DUF4437 domain-containing protein [Alphaproteobacteria bacterium]|nr:DUF4437 domain-containing protein [Alphaproteobacteria bacterium]
MARPHIEFIQAQALPWSNGLYGSGRADVESKILSLDSTTKASTGIVRYPAGWSRPTAEHLTVDEEFLVLDGVIEINGQRYHEYCYANLPAGYVRRTASSTPGAVLLSMFSGEPRVVAGDRGPTVDRRKLVAFIDAYAQPWGGAEDVGNPGLKELGVRAKWLRRDPDTGEETYMLAMLPWTEERTETHPVVQEMFLLSGELAGGSVGMMQPGGYFWRPEDKIHGPFTSRTGNLVFMRAMGGRLATTFHGRKAATHSPAFNPILPPELRSYAKAPAPTISRY